MAFMKKSHWITFPVDKHTKIIIPLQDPIEWLGPMYEEHILLFSNNHKVFLSKSTIYHDMIDLVDLLKQALSNNLQLDRSIEQNIGYLVHQYHLDETKVLQHSFPNRWYGWIGYKYKLWEGIENNTRLMSWIYNAPDGSIIFEVTPFYPYMYCELEDEPDYIPYEEWIKTYKPYFIATLSKETALQWLEQAERIIKIVEDNQKRWDNRLKQDVES